MARPTTLFCSFCRRSEHDVSRLLAGPGVHICDRCVEACNRILDEHGDGPVADLSRVPDDDLLRTLRETEGDLSPAALDLTVGELRRRAVAWSRIGAALGISRQAAWERFSRDDRPRA